MQRLQFGNFGKYHVTREDREERAAELQAERYETWLEGRTPEQTIEDLEDFERQKGDMLGMISTKAKLLAFRDWHIARMEAGL